MDRRAVEERLRAAGCVAADAEADELLAAAPDGRTLEAWIERRETGEPLAWIVGATTFCGIRVAVDPGVFVPRAQTEELARRAAAATPPGGAVADLCTGSGAVAAAVTHLVPSVSAIGADVDPRAARCAASNGVAAVVGDLGAPLRDRSVDVVVAVAPYVPTDELAFLPAEARRFEPTHALDGGADGLELVLRVAMDATRLLRPEGRLFLEIGGDQALPTTTWLTALGYVAAQVWSDSDGLVRGIEAQTPAA
jgi:release factor glutamine methyltransferase